MNNKKQLSINLIANIMSFTISIGVSFLLTPFLIKHIGKEAYGFFPLANNFVTYINLLVIALNSMAARFIMLEVMKNDIEKANIYFNSVFYSNVIMIIFLVIPLSLIILFMDRFLNVPAALHSEVQLLFSLVFLTFLISVLGSVFHVATVATNRLDLRSYQDMIQSGIKGTLFIFLFAIFLPSIIYVGIVILSVSVIGNTISIYLTKRLLPKLRLSIVYFNKKAIKELLSSGVWGSFNHLSVILLTGLDLLLANIFYGAAKAGEYSIAQTVPIFIASLIGMLVGVFIPPLATRYANNDNDGFIQEINFSSKVLGVLISVPISGFIVFGDDFYRLWVPGEDASYLHLLSIIMMAPYLISGSINILFNVNIILNKVKVPSIMLFSTGALNVILMLILIKFTNLGLLAISISSSTLSVIRNCLFTPIYPAKCLSVKWATFYPLIIRNVLTMTVLAGVFYLIKGLINVDQWLDLMIIAFLCGIAGYMISIVISLDKKELKKLYQIMIARFVRRSQRKHEC
ncbi:oligosaccharide flippase family protein [Bacillus sp. S/N-304-OC-R1]|uniref:oligosaccharide flippase family protein n=1 Tax=Bacillus sp. S/N-304-OC-R1 TaxID=2758034 RepID=UPI001C8D40A8|nr:oligosaccharide flippase family protein [Bacillus sp. S/N-304-OC-R1]MBY0124245.1 oligosaccharide flippase family protein [Bacillus sp. S/N-304-OC-R1]